MPPESDAPLMMPEKGEFHTMIVAALQLFHVKRIPVLLLCRMTDDGSEWFLEGRLQSQGGCCKLGVGL